MKAWTILFFLLVTLGCTPLFSPKAEEGVLDLRNYGDLEGPVNLEGQWNYFSNEILFPQNLEDHEGTLKTVPGGWSGDGWGTWHLRIFLPSYWQNQVLVFRNRDINSAARIYIDGELLYEMGRPGTQEDAHFPAYLHLHGRVEPKDEFLDLVIQVSNFELGSGGLNNAPQIGLADPMLGFIRHYFFLDSVILGALLIMFGYHFLLFIIRKDPPPGHFSAIILFVIIRTLCLNTTLYQWFPQAYEFLVKLEYNSFFLIPPLFLFFLHSIYPKEFHSLVSWIVFWVSLGAVALTFLGPLSLASRFTLMIFQFITLILVLYVVRGLFLALFRKREDIVLFLLGIVFLVGGTVHDILFYLGFMGTSPLGQFGLLVFIFFQAAIMANRYTRVFFQYEDLNVNLEKQVAHRTQELNETMLALQEVSLTDPLTGLRNRRFVYETIFPEAAALLKRWEYTGKSFGVFVLDIDYFKKTNDRYGHEAGDILLQSFSKILLESVREDDLVIRWGGEEFLIVLRNIEPNKLPEVGKKILCSIEGKDFPLNHHGSPSVSMSASLGGALFPFLSHAPEDLDFSQVIKLADMALYQSKAQGRGRVTLVEPGAHFKGLKKAQTLDQSIHVLEKEGLVVFNPV